MVEPSAPADDARAPVASSGAQDVLDDDALSASDAVDAVDVTGDPAAGGADGAADGGIEALVVTDTSRPWWLIGVGIVALAVVVALVGWFVVRNQSSRNSGASSGTVTIKDITDYDPSGTDGVENPGTVHLAIDGDVSTSWSTQKYGTPDFDGDKAGVGLVLDLGKAVPVTAVEAESDSSGWSAEVYVADTAGALLDDWGQPVATGTDLPASVRLALPQPKTGRFVLLWITRLPERGELAVAEVRVVS